MNLLKRLRALAITAPVFVAGCADVTSPEQRLQIPIDGISVPSTAAPTDTVVIGFRYEASCGEREVTLRLKPDSLVVSVVAVYPSAGLVCPGMAAFVYRTVSLTPAARALPFSAGFYQPIVGDSVRVMHVETASMDAP